MEDRAVPRALGNLLTVVALAGSVAIVGLMLGASQRGLDFTDEGFYLASIADPGAYSTTVSQFGFVYHPLFELLGSDIVRMRQANILVTFGIAFLLAEVAVRGLSATRLQRAAMAAAFATASLMMFSHWLITPSYNSLALQSAMLTMAGVVCVMDAEPIKAGWWLIGVGGAVALLAKPTTAVALAVVVVLCLVLTRKLAIRGAMGTVLISGGVLVVSALLIDGSISAFVDRIADDADLIAKLDGGHSVGEAIRIDRLDPGLRLTVVVLLVAGCIALAAYGLQAISRGKVIVAAVSVLAGCAAVGLVVCGHVWELFETNPQRALLMASVPIAAVVIFRRKPPLQQGVLFAAFLILPTVYAFGSNGNYWAVGGSAVVFWAIAALVLIAPSSPRSLPVVLLSLGIVTQLITAGLLVGAARSPYRQPASVSDQDVRIQVAGSTVKVGAGFADYLREAQSATEEAGFVGGMPMIDLTGKSPTLLYALGAKSIGQAWMIGAYPGSEKVAAEALRLAGCRDVSVAWVLTEPDGPRRIPDTALTGVGVDFATDYEMAGTWFTAPGVAGFADPVRQVLWKPVRPADVARDACRAALGGQE